VIVTCVFFAEGVFTELFPSNESACHSINEKFDSTKFCVNCGEVEMWSSVEQRREIEHVCSSSPSFFIFLILVFANDIIIYFFFVNNSLQEILDHLKKATENLN
jgi:hypothetical protein